VTQELFTVCRVITKIADQRGYAILECRVSGMKRAPFSFVCLQAADTGGPLTAIPVDAQRLRARDGNLRSLPPGKSSQCRCVKRSCKRHHELFVTCDTAHYRVTQRHVLLGSLRIVNFRRSDETRVIFDEYRFFHAGHFPTDTDSKKSARFAS
jgi:hypothetical protein